MDINSTLNWRGWIEETTWTTGIWETSSDWTSIWQEYDPKDDHDADEVEDIEEKLNFEGVGSDSDGWLISFFWKIPQQIYVLE